jgi:hypothetical protein
MRDSSATLNTDFRLQACKHERLRAALEFPRRQVAAVTVAAPAVACAKNTSDRSHHFLGGAVATLVLSFGFFMATSYNSVDFSVYETDPTAPRVVSTI